MKATIDIQMRAMILQAIDLLDVTTVERMKEGSVKGFLNNWIKRPTAFYKSPRISGVVSNLEEEGVLRKSGYSSRTPLYTKGERFDEELERVFDTLYTDESINIEIVNGQVELMVDTNKIYIPLETLYEYFTELGYFEEEEGLLL